MTRQLNSEWESLGGTPAHWLDGTPTLDSLLARIPADPDRSLFSLIMACQDGFPLAGRVVVQALLPKLVLLSHSYPFPGVDHLVPALWVRIARYPLDRRPNSVAANLFMDARKDVLAENQGLVVAQPPLFDASFTAQDVVDAARALGLATTSSLAILESVYVHGLPREHVAELYGISYDAVRRRCSDTMRRLRAKRSLLTEFLAP